MVAQDCPLPQIINLHTNRDSSLTYIKIDRGSEWGNPFVMASERDRHKVCDQFEQYAHWRLTIEPRWIDPIRGQNLACWCVPKRCHAETLLRLANGPRRIEYPVLQLIFGDKPEPICQSQHKKTTIFSDDLNFPTCGGFWTYCVECGWVTGGGMIGHN